MNLSICLSLSLPPSLSNPANRPASQAACAPSGPVAGTPISTGMVNELEHIQHQSDTDEGVVLGVVADCARATCRLADI